MNLVNVERTPVRETRVLVSTPITPTNTDLQ